MRPVTALHGRAVCAVCHEPVEKRTASRIVSGGVAERWVCASDARRLLVVEAAALLATMDRAVNQ